MMKKIVFCLLAWSTCNTLEAAAPKAGMKLDLVNSLMQLMIRCLDYKLENEMFRTTLIQMQQVLEDMGPLVKEKAALQEKIAHLLMVIAVINQAQSESIE